MNAITEMKLWKKKKLGTRFNHQRAPNEFRAIACKVQSGTNAGTRSSSLRDPNDFVRILDNRKVKSSREKGKLDADAPMRPFIITEFLWPDTLYWFLVGLFFPRFSSPAGRTIGLPAASESVSRRDGGEEKCRGILRNRIKSNQMKLI